MPFATGWRLGSGAIVGELDILCQRLFGKKSQRVDPQRLKLALEQLAGERGPIAAPVGDQRPCRATRLGALARAQRSPFVLRVLMLRRASYGKRHPQVYPNGFSILTPSIV
jgi:hypothetical protein